MSKRNVYHVNEIREHKFYQVPKKLVLNTYYKELSNDAKLLYAILSDRMELSRDNNWINEDNEIYLIFTRKHISELLNVSLPTVTKAFDELKEKELIYEERVGLNKPNRIYIGKIDNNKGEDLDSNGKLKKLNSGNKNNLSQEENNINPNDTELNNTDINKTEIKGNGFKEPFNIRDGKQVSTPAYFFNNRTVQEHLNENYPYRKERIINFVEYYLDKYEEYHYRKEHPKLKLLQWDKVFIHITKACDGEYNREIELTYEDFMKITDKHFKTKYNNGNCDYNLNHFVSGNIMVNRCYEIGIT